MDRRTLVAGLMSAAGMGGLAWVLRRPAPPARAGRPPNVILILTDDQGYNDLGCYWSDGSMPRIDTPRLDGLAAGGVRLTRFYVAASVCTPSRASILTGCYPPRVGFAEKEEGPGVLTPESRVGLNPDETTLAEVLRGVGYRTACVGKWHLGHHAPFLPTNHGFDDFFGIPYSNNQRPLPLMRDQEVLRMLPDEPVLVGQFTQAALTFLAKADDRPFFLYLAHSAPHWPFGPSSQFTGRSSRGAYGDVVQQIDASVGEILDALERLGLSDNTLVIFTSDNGPWLNERVKAGDAFPFRGGKADVWEGGFRSPFLARWPGVLPAGEVRDEVVTALDLLPTLSGLAGARVPAVDGQDAWPVLLHDAPSPTSAFFYYARGRLEGVRDDRFKRVFENPLRDPPVRAALYDLDADPGETTDVSAEHPDVVANLDARADAMRADLGDGLRGLAGSGRRSIGSL